MALDTAKATATLRDLTARFDNAVRAATPFYPSVCTTAPSDGADEKYAWLGNLPGMREWLGERQLHELRAANFVVENQHWETSLRIKKTDLEDDRMGMYRMLMPQMGVEAALHPDELLFETLLVGGESTACFDGQFFFDTDHSWGDSGSQSNDLTYNATDPNAVTAAEFRAAYHQALVAMVQFKNDQGKALIRPVHTGLRNVIVIVPPQLWDAAVTGLTATLTGGGDTNIVLEQPRIVVSPFLTTATKFYVIHAGGPLKPFVWQPRSPLKRQIKNLADLQEKDALFLAEARYAMSYLAWWSAVLTTFT